MDYLDFDLEIGSGQGRDYTVAVRSPAGEAQDMMVFPYDRLVLESRLKDLQIALLSSGGARRQVLTAQEETVRHFGQELFDLLIAREVRTRYDVSRQQAYQQNKGLRLRLHIHPPTLAALPWEFLYDARNGDYVCLSFDTPLVRYLQLSQPISPLAVNPPLRILGMIASPQDLPPLDVQKEKQRVELGISRLQAQGLVELVWLEGQTWRDLRNAMLDGPWHIFHFVGHGGFDERRDEGLIALADAEGRARFYTANEFSHLLVDHRALRFVLLNACEGARGSTHDVFSSTAATLVHRGIAAVVAMQYAITDDAAIEFARTFYERLASGHPVDASVTEARKAILFEIGNTLEWGTPVLYMRAPDGRLFDFAVIERAQPSDHIEPSVTPPKPAVEQPVTSKPATPIMIERPGIASEFNIVEIERMRSSPHIEQKAELPQPAVEQPATTTPTLPTIIEPTDIAAEPVEQQSIRDNEPQNPPVAVTEKRGSIYWFTGILGFVMAAAPFVLGYSSHPFALWMSIVLGLVVLLASLIKAMDKTQAKWEWWVIGVAGIVAMITPYVFGFALLIIAFWIMTVLGAIIFVLAVSGALLAETKQSTITSEPAKQQGTISEGEPQNPPSKNARWPWRAAIITLTIVMVLGLFLLIINLDGSSDERDLLNFVIGDGIVLGIIVVVWRRYRTSGDI